MTEGKPSGAITDDQIDWEAINWQKVEKEVKRLQARIVKAVEAGRHNKVKSLQGLLTRSLSGKLLAIRRVTENEGSKTPGIDKVTWEHRRSKEMAVTLLRKIGYKPQPLRRIYIPKSNGKMRPLGIPTMLDRAMQALHLLALDPIAESTADPNSYGFRVGRSCADAIEQCFCLLKGGQDRWIFEGDIKGCFDHISHEWLLKNVPMDCSILRQWLGCGYLEKNVFTETREGTPQGGIISPVLANLTLDGLEPMLRQHFPRIGPGSGSGRKARIGFVRYADDFVITASSKELLETQVRPLVAGFLRERGLELSIEKTTITALHEGFDFLGQNIRAFGDKTIIQPSKKNIAAFLSKIRKVIRDNKQATAACMVQLLNPIIRGWASYHRHACSKKAFSYVDHQIFQCLWNWAKRRHPHKNRHWVSNKYFGRIGQRNWCFFGEEANRNGERRTYWLRHASSTSIIRHDKVHSLAHPYAPAWVDYWQKRQRRKSKSASIGTTVSATDLTPEVYVRQPRPVWGV